MVMSKTFVARLAERCPAVNGSSAVSLGTRLAFRYESTYLDLAYLNYQVNLNMHVFYYAMYNRQYLAQYLVEWRAQAI